MWTSGELASSFYAFPLLFLQVPRVTHWCSGRRPGARAQRACKACFSSRTICTRLSLAQHAAVTGLEIR